VCCHRNTVPNDSKNRKFWFWRDTRSAIYIYIYIYIYISVYTHIHTHVHTHIYTHMCVCYTRSFHESTRFWLESHRNNRHRSTFIYSTLPWLVFVIAAGRALCAVRLEGEGKVDDPNAFVARYELQPRKMFTVQTWRLSMVDRSRRLWDIDYDRL
jgi:hypothetical protein